MAEVTLKSAAHHLWESFGFSRAPAAPVEPIGTEDPFHDPVLMWIGLAFVLMLIVIVVLTGVVHWGVEYQSPSWNSHAYPPAIVH
jgi:hypothetical protein